jgi:uncharacterized membrane protein
MTLPVLFIMISHHHPMTYGAERPWLVLALLALTGVAVRHVFNLRGRGKATGPTLVLAAALALATVTYVTLEKERVAPGAPQKLGFADVQPVLSAHCAGCHNVDPPPLGVKLASWEQVRAAAPRIKAVAVDSAAMPLGNPTGMTPAERRKLGAWIAAGAPR